jgi:hypothetical protein
VQPRLSKLIFLNQTIEKNPHQNFADKMDKAHQYNLPYPGRAIPDSAPKIPIRQICQT